MKSVKHPSALPFSLFPVEGPTGHRVERLEHLLFEEIDRIFRLEVVDPRLQAVSVVSLQLSPDYRNARVLYALVPQEEPWPSLQALREGFAKVTPFVRARLSEQLGLKRTPQLAFHRDRTAEASLRAQSLMHSSTNESVPKD